MMGGKEQGRLDGRRRVGKEREGGEKRLKYAEISCKAGKMMWADLFGWGGLPNSSVNFFAFFIRSQFLIL